MNNTRETYFYILLISLLVMITYYPYLFVGFTTLDDTLHNLYYSKGVNLFSSSLTFVANSSIARPLFAFFMAPPYFFDSFYYFKSIQIIASFFSVALFAFFVKKLTESVCFSILFFVVFLTFLQNSWNHNIMTSYPFYYHFSLALLILSFITLIKFMEQNKVFYLFCSHFLFLIVLMSYEMYMVYLPIYFILIYYFGKKYEIQAKKRVVISIPYILSAFFLIVLYFYVKMRFSNKYTGTSIEPKNLFGVLSVLWQFSISAFPTYIYNNIYWLYENYTLGKDIISYESLSFSLVLKKMKLVWLIKAVIASSLILLLLNKLEKINSQQYLWLAPVSFVYIFIPNLPLSLTSKYQTWVANNDISYVTTHYSYFAVTIFLVSVVGIIKRFLNSKKKIFGFSAFLVILTIYGSIVTDYANSYVFKTQYQATAKWRLVDKFLSSNYFKELPNGSTIIAPSLWKKYAILENRNSYWSNYFKNKSGKNIAVIRETKSFSKNSNKTLFFMKFNQQNSDSNQYIAIGKIEGIIANETTRQSMFYSSEVMVFDSSEYNYGYIWGKIGKGSNEIIINNREKYVVKNSIFILPFRFLYEKKSGLKMLVLKSKEIAINTINITNYNVSYF